MSALFQQSARPKRPAPTACRRPFFPSRTFPALLAAAFACLLPLSAALPARADAPKNSIVAIRSVVDGRRPATYNITVTSTAEFPMNNSVVTLSIGGQEFINSSYAPGGTLNTLVFSLTRSQFLSLKSGASVVVYYGADNAALPAAQWSFGPLDLSMLDRVTPVLPVSTAPMKVLAAHSVKASQTAATPSAHAALSHSATTLAASPQKGKK